MPLPAYLTEQPKTNPTTIIARQIRNLGIDVDIVRTGATLTVQGIELDPDNSEYVDRAIRLLSNYADANRLSTDAIVYPVQANVIERYIAHGFEIHLEPQDEDEEGAHTLLRRIARQ